MTRDSVSLSYAKTPDSFCFSKSYRWKTFKKLAKIENTFKIYSIKILKMFKAD